MRGRAFALAVLAAACSKRPPPSAKADDAANAGARADVAVVVDAAVAPASVDAPVAGGRWRPSTVIPVFHHGGRSFVPLAGWYLPADGSAPSVDWAAAPAVALPEHDRSARRLRLHPVPSAPPSWRGAFGARVQAYDAGGRACPTSIAALGWLAEVWFEGDALDEGPIFVGELAPVAGCAPVLVTDRARFGARREPTAASSVLSWPCCASTIASSRASCIARPPASR
jgi:hypothetical protein